MPPHPPRVATAIASSHSVRWVEASRAARATRTQIATLALPVEGGHQFEKSRSLAGSSRLRTGLSWVVWHGSSTGSGSVSVVIC